MEMTRKNNMFPALALAAAVTALLAAACATPAGDPAGAATKPRPPRSVPGVSPELAEAAQRTRVLGADDPAARTYKGTGVVVRGQQPNAPSGLPPTTATGGGAVVLNFEGADLREVVKNILGDILNESYTMDASVGGQVTIRTSSGIARSALPATLETLLRMNGATMVKEDGLYKILPSAVAVRGNVTPQLGNSQRPLPPGFSVQVVPLRYIGTREMMRILEPIAKDATAVRPDDLRNLLVLSGTERELRHLLETIDLFDVDWIAGMSVGLFTLQNSDVKAVGQELDRIIGDRNLSPLTGILRIVPIERMNAILVITPQPAYLEEAKKWITRLDSGGGGDGPRFYVYNLQNQRAEKLGPLLTQAFTGRAAPATTTGPPTVAPGTPPGQIVSPPAFQPQATTAPPPAPAVQVTLPPPGAGAAAALAARATDGIGIVRNIQVVADKDNNTLLIVATPPEYMIIEQALKKLDVPSRQVAIEVTIASVTLTDELDFGVEWLFKGGAPNGRGAGGLIIRSTPFNPGGSQNPNNTGLGIANGFTYIIQNANFPGGIQAILHLLDTYGDTKVVANPHLAALDNQKATIKAGNKIPINQQSFVGSGTNVNTNVVTTTSQYIDTGVLLQVTPHINAGGLITLDVQAEVSDPGPVANSGDAPPINTRSVQTIVSVQSGQTLVMGGLIGETTGNTSKGLPLLSRIPILGGLFGEQSLTKNRTELVMFITPRLVENENDLKNTIEDLRRRMQQIDDTFDVFRRARAPDVYSDAPGALPPAPAPAMPNSPPAPRP
jgi:general secretion pathway protein D